MNHCSISPAKLGKIANEPFHEDSSGDDCSVDDAKGNVTTDQLHRQF